MFYIVYKLGRRTLFTMWLINKSINSELLDEIKKKKNVKMATYKNVFGGARAKKSAQRFDHKNEIKNFFFSLTQIPSFSTQSHKNSWL